MLLMAKNKEPLYVEIDTDLKRRISRLAEARQRKLTAEVSIALKRYLEAEEPKEGLAADDVEEPPVETKKTTRPRKPKSPEGN